MSRPQVRGVEAARGGWGDREPSSVVQHVGGPLNLKVPHAHANAHMVHVICRVQVLWRTPCACHGSARQAVRVHDIVCVRKSLAYASHCRLTRSVSGRKTLRIDAQTPRLLWLRNACCSGDLSVTGLGSCRQQLDSMQALRRASPAEPCAHVQSYDGAVFRLALLLNPGACIPAQTRAHACEHVAWGRATWRCAPRERAASTQRKLAPDSPNDRLPACSRL